MYGKASMRHFIANGVVHGYGIVANRYGNGLTRLAGVPQVVGSQISVDMQNSGLVRADAVIARDVEVGRDNHRFGSEAYHVAPVAGAINTAISTNLDRVWCFRTESIQSVGVRGNIDEIGFVAVDADLPFGGVAVLGPR